MTVTRKQAKSKVQSKATSKAKSKATNKAKSKVTSNVKSKVKKSKVKSKVKGKVKSTRKKRSGGVAQTHHREPIMQLALRAKKALKELDMLLAQIVVANKDPEPGTVDLHGLGVPEAIKFAKSQVLDAKSRGDEVVRFIVGKGLHSDAGEAKIRPALEGHFNKQGLKHSLDPENSGVLIVQLD